MSGVFNIAQVVNARGLDGWYPSGGGSKPIKHKPIEEDEEMAANLDGEILAALQKHGPCSPKDLAAHVGVDRPAISNAIKPLIDAKKVKVSGSTKDRMLALPGQAFIGADTKPKSKAKQKAPPTAEAAEAEDRRRQTQPHRIRPRRPVPAAREDRPGHRCD